jgi:high-affinity Fe2+/Pb2+ permease
MSTEEVRAMELVVIQKMERNLILHDRRIQLEEAALVREMGDPQRFPNAHLRAVQLQVYQDRRAAAVLELAQRLQAVAAADQAERQLRGEE